MTANINLDSPVSVPALSATREIQAGKIASPDTRLAQLPQDYSTISSLGDMVTAALQQPEVRADKVSAIKEAIASGTYQVDPHAIALAMLAVQL